jgi:hypothetical protein
MRSASARGRLPADPTAGFLEVLMALDPELARRVDPALSEIASRLDEASRLAADATLRLRDFGLPVPTQVSAAVAALLDHAHRVESFRRSLPT